MDPFLHTGLCISDSLKSVRKSVLIYETIITLFATVLTNQCDIIEGQICGFGIAAESSVGVSDIRSSILDLLRPLGITERYFGVRQLIQAVEMVMENPDTIHALQKEVYDVIALQYSVSWGAIERNLRIISQRAWDTDPVYIEKLAGYPMSKRPTASQLIEIILHNVQREQ